MIHTPESTETTLHPNLQNASIEEIGGAVAQLQHQLGFYNSQSGFFPWFFLRARLWQQAPSFTSRHDLPVTGAAEVADVIHLAFRALGSQLGKMLDTDRLPPEAREAVRRLDKMIGDYRKNASVSDLQIFKAINDFVDSTKNLPTVPVRIDGKTIDLGQERIKEASGEYLNIQHLLFMKYAAMDRIKMPGAMLRFSFSSEGVGRQEILFDNLCKVYRQLEIGLEGRAALPDLPRERIADAVEKNLNYLIGAHYINLARRGKPYPQLFEWVGKTQEDIKPTKSLLEAAFLLYCCCDPSQSWSDNSSPPAYKFADAVERAVEKLSPTNVYQVERLLRKLRGDPKAPFDKARAEFERQLQESLLKEWSHSGHRSRAFESSRLRVKVEDTFSKPDEQGLGR